MVNYRVADLHALLAALRSEGCNVDESEFGRFGWAIDPEGNKAELWEESPASRLLGLHIENKVSAGKFTDLQPEMYAHRAAH